MARTLKLAVIQSPFGAGEDENIAAVEEFVREAAASGVRLVLPPELFSGPYFCKTQDADWFRTARPADEHPAVLRLAALAGELGVVIPISFFEKAGPHYYNSLAMADADGRVLGVYRKSHIPDGPGYQEKFYFRPGDTGFMAFDTAAGRIGAGICWDQWFPEAARAMALQGAEVLLYPTAIGSEPHDAGLDTAARWRRAMVGHAVSNVIPVAAANRIGDEDGQVFYGTSFIADEAGGIVSELGRDDIGVAIAELDLDRAEDARASWGFFRDRRTELYGEIAGD